MSALSVLTLALRSFRLGGAAKLVLLFVAAQVAIFGGVILQTRGDVAHARTAISVAVSEQQQEPSTGKCREEAVTLDEGYGLRGHDRRMICGW
jgi:hypothetical protein